jgi:DUF971 family protein
LDSIPIQLLKHDAGRVIEIRWSDGWVQQLLARQLRDHCPCATCREQAAARRKKQAAGVRALNILSDAELQPVTVVGMTPAGSYAYNVAFSDGHRSGVFTLEYLRQLIGISAESSEI